MMPGKKTTWCQNCVEERKELREHTTPGGKSYWVCGACDLQLKKDYRRRAATKAPSKAEQEEMEKAERLCAERMRKRSSGRRVVQEGEKLQEARVDFSHGSVPLSSHGPMDVYVGLKWSYGWGPNEDQ